jgi:hypothetical protein
MIELLSVIPNFRNAYFFLFVQAKAIIAQYLQAR